MCGGHSANDDIFRYIIEIISVLKRRDIVQFTLTMISVHRTWINKTNCTVS